MGHSIVIEFCLVSKWAITMQLVIAIESVTKFQPLTKISRFEMLHQLHAV
jgi:hypothetical protein